MIPSANSNFDPARGFHSTTAPFCFEACAPTAVAYLGQGLGGFADGKSSWGSGGRCEPPSGVRGSAPENFENNAF